MMNTMHTNTVYFSYNIGIHIAMDECNTYEYSYNISIHLSSVHTNMIHIARDECNK